MPTPLDTTVVLASEYPPVEDLLLVYLGQSCGSRAPESDERHPIDVHDLWDHLGDFA
jgi:hypothetical protein